MKTRNKRRMYRKTRNKHSRHDDDNFIVVSADGRLCVNGAARSNLAAALAQLRALPPDVTAMLGDFQTTMAALEAAIAAPTSLEVSMYYELVASFEDASAQAMQTLHDMAPPDDVTPGILATVHLALARAQCFRYFATVPGDDATARAYLMTAAGVPDCLDASLNSPTKTIVPEEAEFVATKMRSVAKSFASFAPALARGAEALATRLTSKPPMALHEYFAEQAEVFEELSTTFMRSLQLHQKLSPEQRRQSPVQISDEEWLTRGQQFALASAACGLLVRFFTPRSRGDDDRPRLILN